MPRIIIFTLLTLIFVNFPLKAKGCEEFGTVDYQNLSQLNSARSCSLKADNLKTLDTTFTTYISSKSPNWIRSICQKFEVCRETVGSYAKTFKLVCRKFGIVHIETKLP